MKVLLVYFLCEHCLVVGTVAMLLCSSTGAVRLDLWAVLAIAVRAYMHARVLAAGDEDASVALRVVGLLSSSWWARGASGARPQS